MEPKVILVDLLDKPLGELSKREAHCAPRLHRAFSVFLHDGSKMLLQQRALNKYHCGGLWANACCSHPRAGESLSAAAVKRLWEETGICCDDLRPLFEFTYMAKFDNQLFEYECDHVFLGQYSGSFQSDPSEVEQMCWMECDQLLRDMVEKQQKYAPWFLICAPQVIRTITRQAWCN